MNDNGGALTLSAENFDAEVLQAQGIVLVDCFSETCGPCKLMAPLIDELAMDDSVPAKVCKLDIGQARDIAARYRVRSVPTFIYFKDGEVALRSLGSAPKKSFLEALETLVSKDQHSLQEKSLQGDFHLLLSLKDAGISALREMLQARPELATQYVGAKKQLPVNLAAYNRRADVVDLLLEFGANLHPVDLVTLDRSEDLLAALSAEPSLLNSISSGFCPLDVAIMYNKADCVEILLEAGADLGGSGRLSNGYVLSALQSCNVKLARKLVKAGANPEPEGCKLTLLHAAAHLCKALPEPELKQLIDFAVEHSVDSSRWINDSKKPSDIAREKQCDDIADYLLEIEAAIQKDIASRN